MCKRKEFAIRIHRHLVTIAAVLLATALPARSRAQAAATTIQPAASSVQAPNADAPAPDSRGRKLLDAMVEALGGSAWLNLKDMEEQGRIASFEQGRPTGSNVQFFDYVRFPMQERIEYATPRNLMPGSVHDIIQVWTPETGFEVTYKGKKPMIPKLVEDYNRLRHHSIREVVTVWMKRPGVVVVLEGTTMVERRLADKFTILSPDNDAVTIATDQTTHLPLRRTFEWRNQTFHDRDEDAEEYEDYHTIDGLPTPLSVTRYHNGDMIAQRFITKVEYGKPLPPEMYDPNHLPVKK